MIGKIQAYVEQNQMIAPQSHVVAGVSGGADSVCLLFVLGEIKKRLPFTMEAVHINHKLREEAEDDAAFVGEICAQLGVSLRVFAADVGEMARAKGLSLEEAGRDYRYECLRMVANEHEAGIIAVAHHLDDRAETLLFNLFRGSGLKGLAGIRPVRGDIIRPLLGCTRQEIEAYLAERGIPYRIDPSNASEANTRSFIRQQIMPRAKEVNPAAVENMAKTADLAAEAERFVREQARAAFRECAGVYRSERAIYNRPYVGMSTIAPVCRGGCQPPVTHIEINIDKLHTFDPFLQKYVLLLAFEELSPGRQGIALPHVTDVLELAQGGGSKELHLPYGLRAYKEYERLVLG
ncbi:MAG: tRNA lysidine(34) synthetase TilS, partial [Lachnospiraceae bacterium]|nr:tRNA lysidine(34) synthetase TilS [Lachnospiraceae bacterium]